MSPQQTDPPDISDTLSPDAHALVGGVRSSRTSPLSSRDRHGSSASHSRFVKLMKTALPLVALILVVLIMAWPYFGNNKDGFKIEFSTLKILPGEDTGVDNARYFGVDDLSRPFTISADLARFPHGPKGVITLEVPKADMTLDDGTWLVMTSKVGKYDQQKKLLELSGDVNMFHDMGYEIITEEIDINLAKSDAIGTKPVSGHGPFGELNANGVRIDKNNQTIFFLGRSRLLLFPASGKKTSADENVGGNK